jgi:CO dehydrogenase/acetyl-CoA synthase epsilon subunit
MKASIIPTNIKNITVPAKTKQVAVQPPRVVKQVVYRAPKPLTPAEQKAEVENIFATIFRTYYFRTYYFLHSFYSPIFI